MISLTACALQTSIPTPASTCQPIFIQALIIKCRLWNRPCWSHHALVLPLLVVLCCSLQHFPHSNYCFEAHLESLSECVYVRMKPSWLIQYNICMILQPDTCNIQTQHQTVFTRRDWTNCRKANKYHPTQVRVPQQREGSVKTTWLITP